MSTQLFLIIIISCLVRFSRCVSYTNFAFGDSVVDAGNNNYLPSLSKANYSPYGIDFTPTGGKPTGRYTNGFTIVDIVARALGAKTLPIPSLSSNALSNAIHGGINYASGASGILEDTGTLFVARIPLSKQIDSFERNRGEMVKMMGENGTQHLLKNAIFSLTTGSNDIITYFLPNLPFVGNYDFTPTTLQDTMISNMTLHLKRLHKLGARKVVVVDIGPLGCIPFVRDIHFLAPGKCHEEMNTLIQGYNQKLRMVVQRLNQEMGFGSIFVYANSYDVIMGMLQNYRSYGFENVNNPCCGGSIPPLCFRLGDESEISTSLCEDRSKYLFFDSYHPGQAANFIIAQHMLNGDENICSPLNVRQLHYHRL
ncbi:GDSL esterase/lipase At5g41890 [Rutidosis leptorrhynchoides]|uniref:GDSL esterase/lipase At5g41890 n=1 Tax=Rutidosis leptorrhynchoides TaxID=125765 RepID=UPI003A9A6354